MLETRSLLGESDGPLNPLGDNNALSSSVASSYSQPTSPHTPIRGARAAQASADGQLPKRKIIIGDPNHPNRTYGAGMGADQLSQNRPLLPAVIKEWLLTTLRRCLGVMLVVAAIVTSLALLSYQASDPSWNTSVSDQSAVHNWLGMFGSYLADGLWQYFGFIAWAFPFWGFVWGGLWLSGQANRSLRLRCGAAILGILLLDFSFGFGGRLFSALGWGELWGGLIGFIAVAGLVKLTKLLPYELLFLSPFLQFLSFALTIGFGAWLYGYALNLHHWLERKSWWRNQAQVPSEQEAWDNEAPSLLEERLKAEHQKEKLAWWAVILSKLWALARGNSSQDEWFLRDRLEPTLQPKLAVEGGQAGYSYTASDSQESENENLDGLNNFDPHSLEEDLESKSMASQGSASPASGAASVAASPRPGNALGGRARPITPRADQQPPQPRQGRLALDRDDDGFGLPPVDLLKTPPATAAPPSDLQAMLQNNARQLEAILQDFGVKGSIVEIKPGPVVTLYGLEPAPGIKSSRVIGLADDIARSMSALSVRIATIPGRNVIGIELPNLKREFVALKELIMAPAYEGSKAKLPLILGKDISGAPEVVDLATMPHLLIAGTTGSGKSVGLNGMILSLLFRLPPQDCRFIMIDPKMLELSVYNDIPHLLTPVVTDPKKAVVALKWTVREMEDRYRAISRLGGVRNIDGYNRKVSEAMRQGEKIVRRIVTGMDEASGAPIFEEEELETKPLPYIVVVVDEMADLMLVAGKEIEASIQRLAQMARAAGIHIIMATQRPSVDVITGTIKANFPTRISFAVTSRFDSRTVLGEQGAEQLLGKGDMLYMAGGGRITRVHGPFVEDSEVEDVCSYLRSQGQPEYIGGVTDEDEISGGFDTDVSGASDMGFMGGGNGGGNSDGASEVNLYDQAVAVVAREGKCSTSFIQRQLRIGYNRAADLVDRMEREGVVTAPNHAGKRDVLVGDQSG